MRIDKLSLKNFRGFEALEIDFPSKEQQGGLAVFIGVNGSGKSSILDGLFIHLIHSLQVLGSNFIGIKMKLLLEGNYEENIHINSKKSCSKLCFSNAEYLYETNFKIDKNESLIISGDFIKNLDNNKADNQWIDLPAIAFYQTDRSISTPPSLIAKDLNTQKLEKTFQLTLNETIDFNYFFEWFRNTEDYENEQRLYVNANYRHTGLEVFRKMLTTFLEGYENPRVRRQPTEKLILEKGDTLLSVTQLSHGEKLMFAIIGDIIRRISITQPSLKNPLLGKGVIMIDEIEQHLHPSWQRTIIPKLRKTFPNIQFIVTTHSPQVLSNVPRENVFILEDFKLVKKTPHTYGKDSNSILYNLFGVNSRPDNAREDFNKLYQLMDTPKKEKEILELIKSLEDKYGENDSDLMEAKLNFEFMND